MKESYAFRNIVKIVFEIVKANLTPNFSTFVA